MRNSREDAVRPPAVAGSFYPAQPAALAGLVAELLGSARAQLARSPDPVIPKALFVPHAGYVYSGSTAALGYAAIAPARSSVRTVVLLGPTHRVAVRGLALPSAAAFATPLGSVRVERPGADVLSGLPQVTVSDAAHELEHSLEVQLPFLQATLEEFRVVPLAVGQATPQEVAQVLAALWGGPETLLVVSSDLSHYLAYQQAQEVDGETVAQLLSLRGPLTHQQACGATPANGLLVSAAERRLAATLLGACNSGDTAGDRKRVVGYAAIAFAGTADVTG